MNELEKMLSGQFYDSGDPDLVALRNKAHKLCYEYNAIKDELDENRGAIIKELISDCSNVYLQGPIYFDYGIFTHFGKNCYANFNLTVLDVANVYIGDNCFFGPNVSLVTAMHPLQGADRRMIETPTGLKTKEYAKEIHIGHDVWLCSNVVVCPGVTIGNNVVIGAGSVVTHNIPDNVLAAGNPCKVIRPLDEHDRLNH